jgi:hypothetical protein
MISFIQKKLTWKLLILQFEKGEREEAPPTLASNTQATQSET